MNRVWMPIFLVALGVSACKSQEEKPKEKVVAAPAPKPEPKPKDVVKPKVKRSDGLSTTFPRTRLSDIPTVADLEDEATRRIKPENLESELDRLEAEIVGVPN